MTRRTYTLTKRQCDHIKEQDRVYVLNATNLVKNAGSAGWVPAVLRRLGNEAVQRWLNAHPIPKTVIAVAFDRLSPTSRAAIRMLRRAA